VIKTTVYLTEELALQVQQVAQAEGRSQAEVLRAAVAAYVGQASLPQSTGIGAYRSGRSDVAQRTDELFADGMRRRWPRS